MAKIKSPPSSGATPRDAKLLARLTTLSQELAGAYRPTTAIQLAARALIELLAPSRISIVLLNAETNRLTLVYDSAPEPAPINDPLLQLALRRGPLLLARAVGAEATRLGVTLGKDAPASWVGAPLLAAGQVIGAVSLSGNRAGAFKPHDLQVVGAVVAQVAVGLENARLIELLSSAKRE